MKRIATIGFFDGVHTGHQFLFGQLRSEADARGMEPLIITFDVHPRAVLQSDYMPQLLTTLDERKALLRTYAEVVVLPFADIHALTAAEFMERIKAQYEVSVLLMGYDHQFGSDRLRKPQDYRRVGEQCGIEVLTMPEFVAGEWHVSSTEIRQALENGNIAVANELLGRPYSLTGLVVHGKGIGHTIGFPTANVQPDDPCQIIPKAGVYVGKIKNSKLKIQNSELPAFVNIDTKGVIEVHIPAFKGDLYGQPMTIQFMRFLREERQFKNLEALREQIKADIDSIRHQA
ncbi:MAG: riboflavin biosynthesis protein RibF [Paludibacteraceae bacterium]|nr:riboflavin biosynthesis protein RibF [Paludibacteraceae bacterium]MBQ6984982.1 riboflavin biosynthesis protein RibF [Paludibacteraceae bacterium]